LQTFAVFSECSAIPHDQPAAQRAKSWSTFSRRT
jgi:hypothetical protein